MADNQIKGLEVLVSQRKQEEEDRSRELAAASSALNLLREAERQAQVSTEGAQKELDRSKRLSQAELAAGVTAQHLAARAAYQARLEADLEACRQREEKARQERKDGQQQVAQVQQALAQAAAERAAAEKLLKKQKLEQARIKENKADEEATEQAAARSKKGDR